jgi:hypothetical protein
VLLAVAPNGFVWREHLQEMIIEFLSRDGDKLAGARQAVPFLMGSSSLKPHEHWAEGLRTRTAATRAITAADAAPQTGATPQ